MFDRLTLARATVALSFVAGISFAQATTLYSLSGDFSDTQNPNGAWSFTQGAVALTHQTPLANGNPLIPALGNGYWGTGPDLYVNTPEIAKVTANGSAAGGTDEDFLIGDVILHSTNPGTGDAMKVNWTAPADGTIDLASSMWYAHSSVRRSNDVEVTLAGAFVASFTLSNSSYAGRDQAIQFSGDDVAVLAGDVLTFTFTPTPGQAFGSIAGLSETISFTATPVPEASTPSMMVGGLILLGWLARRRAGA